MSVENWSDDIVLVNLAREPEMADELAYVTHLVCNKHNCDVVVDCSEVDTLTSSSRSKLMTLYTELACWGHRLVLCNPSSAARDIFSTNGLGKVLNPVDDKAAALAGIVLSHS